MRTIPLSGKKFAIVDDEDYPVLSRFTWTCDNERAVRNIGVLEDKRPILMSYFILPSKKGYRISHKNNNALDNRKSNLVYLHYGYALQRGKKRKNSLSKYKGVSFVERGRKWRAMLYKDGRTYRLGHFPNEETAALAYNKKARELYGEYAYQNDV